MVLEFLSFFCHIAVASLLYTLSLHDALPISCRLRWHIYSQRRRSVFFRLCGYRICSIGRSSRLMATRGRPRSEERRVGKECRCRKGADDLKKEKNIEESAIMSEHTGCESDC